MAATPARAVRWDPKSLSPSFLHSPNFEGSTESYISTSSLEYVNAQLVAHGFAPSPGLSLDGLSGTDSDRIVKCLIGLLSSRVEDMSRTEELSTKLRTLTYDHERLLTMHRIANEKVLNAEKEVNLYKTKLTASQRTLQSAESAHKQTTTELQRTRSTLQGIRATHQQELKKKEKEFDRMADKWNKLSDTQTKLSTVPSGIKCANVAIVDGSDLVPRTPSLLDIALDDAERAREQLIDEVGRLRRLVVKICNQVQAVLYQVQGFIADKDEEPTEYTMTSLFPMHPPTHPHDVLSGILRSLRDTLAALPQHIASSPAPVAVPAPSSSTNNAAATTSKSAESNPENVAHLQATIAQLKEEVELAHAQAQQQAAQTQALFDNFIASQQKTSANFAEMSMELMTAPMADAERERLDKFRQELDNEREKFTRAAVKLGKERVALETDKVKLLEEKRSWGVQQMLADLPPTPDLHDQAHPPNPSHAVGAIPAAQPRRSSRKPKPIHQSPSKKSPRKVHGHKRQSSAGSSSAATRKATRVFRRPSITPSKPTTLPAYETEVIVATTSEPPISEPQAEERQQAPREQQLQPTSTAATAAAPLPPLTAPLFAFTSTTSILPSSFVLPPPSPHASLPRKPLLPPPSLASSSSQQQFLSIPQPDFLMTHLPPPTPNGESTPFPQAKTQAHDQGVGEMDANANLTVTPVKRPFPVAKPFAQRMVHAYSPAKPSPLSRILLLNNSPDTSASDTGTGEGSSSTIDARFGLGAAREDETIGMQLDEETFPEVHLPEMQTPLHQQGPEHRMMSLAAELGVESPPDILEVVDQAEEEQEQQEPPLKKRKSDTTESGSGRGAAVRGNTRKPATSAGTNAGARKPPTGLSAGGAKERPNTRSASGSGGGGGGGEKENTAAGRKASGTRTSGSTSATASSAARATGARATRPAAARSTTTTNTTTRGKPAAGGAGPRRVPINSAEAPTMRRKS
ncbi:hypothetical protein D9756_002214 [Leucocoprinus leucothites]|uniref:Afadin and alpha-actinin-binding-domain-containing protein n=1 Tax=Leucocoprinus leucothites TaxID=201217 RepID=A0A8H5LLD8_9AGAR|nr:hypothetical protein D9756_002214 [Leucoagaricus leucothites]